MDSYARECSTRVVAADDGWWQLEATVFFPGGGGQPPDTGFILSDREELPALDVRSDGRTIWHRVDRPGPLNSKVECRIDWNHRYAVMRHHALLHIVNTVALHRYRGLVTGALIRSDLSRIDLGMVGFDRTMLPDLEDEVNAIIARNLPISSTMVPEAELCEHPDLIRSSGTPPPAEHGKIRVVEIEDFDTQACGGTHVHTTAEIGRARLVDYTNKGRNNKRLYWRLEQPSTPGAA